MLCTTALTNCVGTSGSAAVAGPFEFSYDYHAPTSNARPSFYHLTVSPAANETSIRPPDGGDSRLLLASMRLMSEADILVLPGSYGESLELIESTPGSCGLFAKKLPDEVESRAVRLRIRLWIRVRRPHRGDPSIAQDRTSVSHFRYTCSQAGRGESAGSDWARRWRIPSARGAVIPS